MRTEAHCVDWKSIRRTLIFPWDLKKKKKGNQSACVHTHIHGTVLAQERSEGLAVRQDRSSAWRWRAAVGPECLRLPSYAKPWKASPNAHASHWRCGFASQNWASVSSVGAKRKSQCYVLSPWDCPPKPANGELWRLHLRLPDRQSRSLRECSSSCRSPIFFLCRWQSRLAAQILRHIFVSWTLFQVPQSWSSGAAAKSFSFSVPISKFLLIRIYRRLKEVHFSMRRSAIFLFFYLQFIALPLLHCSLFSMMFFFFFFF